MTCNTFNNPTSKQSPEALTPDQLKAQLYSFGDLNSMQSDPSKKYNFDGLVTNASLTRTYFNQLTDKTQYPMVKSRLEQGPITPFEYAQFLDFSGFSEQSVTQALAYGQVYIDNINYFDQLNYYYDQNMATSISGGFCSLFTGILSQLNSLLSAGAKLLSDLKNFSLENLINDVIGQLNSMLNIFTTLIDKLKDLMLQQIDAIVSKINQLSRVAVSMITLMKRKIDQARDFFSDLSMDSLKAFIESLIAGLAGNYEELTPEVIAYLLYRLCQLVESVNTFMKSPVDGLNSFISNFTMQRTILTNSSNVARLESVQGGLYRLDPFTIMDVRHSAAATVNSHAPNPDGVNPATYITTPFTEEEFQSLNGITENGNQYIQWSPQVLSMGSNESDANPGDGWRKVNPTLILIAMRIAKRMGARLYINSGYRSPQYNAKQPGAASGSQHQSGKALDVSMTNSSGLANTEAARNRFIQVASQEGIFGMGSYNTFIHIDIGQRRYWVSGGSLAQAAEPALIMHKADKFRIGGGAPTVPVSPASSTAI